MEALSDDERDVVECNLAFVGWTVGPIAHGEHDFQELFQIGAIALGGAVQSCDAEIAALTTHAKIRILAAVQRHRQRDQLINVPVYHRYDCKGVKKNTIAHREQAARVLSAEYLEADDTIPERVQESPLYDDDDRDRVRSMLPMLSDIHRTVVKRRLDNWSLSAIGKELGCSKEVARWHERRAVAALRRLLMTDSAA